MEGPERSTSLPLMSREAEEDTIGMDDYERLNGLLRSLEVFFCFTGFYRGSLLHTRIISWLLPLVLGFVVPVLVLYYYSSTKTEVERIVELDIGIPVLDMVLALASLLSVSRNLRKYGVRRFLFVDKKYDEPERLHQQYAHKIKLFYKDILFGMLPCLAIKIAVGTDNLYSTCHEQCSLPMVVLFGSILSWTYLTTIFLAGCSLFSLKCDLQAVHMNDYKEHLMMEKNVSVLLNEHIRLRYYLRKISHRFRLQLIIVFFISIASQFIALLRTIQYAGVVNFVNAGDLFVSSAVQIIGIVLCLIAATRISHRANGVASVASRCHALATCEESDDYQATQSRNLEPLFQQYGVRPLETRFQTLYSQRQALVMYLESNNGAITIYGWSVDRGLITTIVGVELSLLLFIFSGI